MSKARTESRKESIFTKILSRGRRINWDTKWLVHALQWGFFVAVQYLHGASTMSSIPSQTSWQSRDFPRNTRLGTRSLLQRVLELLRKWVFCDPIVLLVLKGIFAVITDQETHSYVYSASLSYFNCNDQIRFRVLACM